MTKTIVLTESQIVKNLQSDKEFPVDFDLAWQWLDYTRKDSALKSLKANFEEGVDFSALKRRASNSGGAAVFYYLTNDCFKMLAMMAGTAKGKEVRLYYLQCERSLKTQQTVAPIEQLSVFPELDKSSAIANAITQALSGAKLGRTEAEKQNLLAGTNLTILGMRHPELRAELMEGHKLLAASTPTPSLLLTPTTLGKRLGLSARAINTLLIEMGFQTRVPKEHRRKGEPDYLPTSVGGQYASNTLATGSGGDTATYQHYKWYESVVDAISEFLTSRTVAN